MIVIRIRTRCVGSSAFCLTFSFHGYPQLLARVNESASEPVKFAQLGWRRVESRGHRRQRVSIAHLSQTRQEELIDRQTSLVRKRTYCSTSMGGVVLIVCFASLDKNRLTVMGKDNAYCIA